MSHGQHDDDGSSSSSAAAAAEQSGKAPILLDSLDLTHSARLDSLDSHCKRNKIRSTTTQPTTANGSKCIVDPFAVVGISACWVLLLILALLY